jgi:phosphoglucomutase
VALRKKAAKLYSVRESESVVGEITVCVAESGWFAARPSGTEDIYKIYAESVRGDDHLRRNLKEPQDIVNHSLTIVIPQAHTSY